MLFTSTNIHEKLLFARRKSGPVPDQLAVVRALLAQDESKRENIRTKLRAASDKKENTFHFDLLETQNIFHISHIKKTCIDYRLRFLDSHYYKIPLPEEAITKIKQLENKHHTTLSGFKLAAPSKVFQLKRFDDPILFAPMGNGYYYLIHKWGNDLHPLRRWLVLPFRNMGFLLAFFLLLSAACSMMLPANFYGKAEVGTMRLISFLFILKYWCAIGIYYGVSRGKNFNTVIWDSPVEK